MVIKINETEIRYRIAQGEVEALLTSGYLSLSMPQIGTVFSIQFSEESDFQKTTEGFRFLLQRSFQNKEFFQQSSGGHLYKLDMDSIKKFSVLLEIDLFSSEKRAKKAK